MPGSVKFRYPRPDDSAFELEADRPCFFLNGDLQHAMVCGNRGTKVSADTRKKPFARKQGNCQQAGKTCVRLSWEVTT